MQQRAGDLEAPHLAAGKIAHLAAGAVGKADARPAPRRCVASLAPCRCRAARRDRAGSVSARDRDRGCAAGTRRPSAAALRPEVRLISWPKMLMRPLWMPNSRVTSENNVLLPAPLRPSSAVKLAGRDREIDVDRGRGARHRLWLTLPIEWRGMPHRRLAAGATSGGSWLAICASVAVMPRS